MIQLQDTYGCFIFMWQKQSKTRTWKKKEEQEEEEEEERKGEREEGEKEGGRQTDGQTDGREAATAPRRESSVW